MRASAVGVRAFFVATAAVACSPSEFSAERDPGAAAGVTGDGAGASGGKGGSATGSGGTTDSSAGAPTAGGSSVGGGRGVVGGAAGMGAYGGKPGTNAMGGSAGGDEPGAGGASPSSGGSGGQAGGSGTTSSAGISGATNDTGGAAGTTGGSMGRAGTGGGASGGTAGTGGTGVTGGSGGMPPIGGCNNELLVNAGFESGKGVGWEETSDWPGIDLVVNEEEPALAAEGVSPYAGSFLAWLGGIPDNEWDHNVTLIQQHVLIPQTASSLTLSGRHLVKSIDDPGAEYDEAYLEFDLDDAVVWQSLRLTNLSASSDWISFSKTTTDIEDLAGKTLLFYAYARTDPTGKTSFFLDSLSLVANCGR